MKYGRIKTCDRVFRKVLALLCMVVFSMNFAAIGIFAETCCKGQPGKLCLCGTLHETAPIVISSAQGCCSQTQRTPCRVSSTPSLPVEEFSLLAVRVWQQSAEIFFMAEDTLPEFSLQYDRTRQPDNGTTSGSTPIYIQHQTLLC